MAVPEEREDLRTDLKRRRDSLRQAGAGAALLAGGSGARMGLDRRLKRHDATNPVAAAYRSARGRPGGFKAGVHLPDLAGRSAARSLQAVGLPLAAYGAVNAVRARPRKVRPVSGEELVHHVARQAVYAPAVDRGEKMSKSTSTTALAALRRVAATNPGTAERNFKRYDPARRAYATKRVRNAEWGATMKRPPTTAEQRRTGVGNTRWSLHGAGGVAAGQPVDDHAVTAASLRALRSRTLLKQTGKPLAKALTAGEQRKLDAHRRFGRSASLVGGTLGLSALALRTPSGAAALARRAPSLVKPTAAMAARDSSRAAFGRAPQKRVLRSLADTEDAATKHSNTAGVFAIGTGAAGSFNYAAQQKLERKANAPVKKFYRDPETGQFTGRNMTDHEYESESQSLAIDVKNLFRSEGDHKAHLANRSNLRAARAYYVHRGEDDLVDNLDRSMRESVKRHRDLVRGGPKKKIVGKAANRRDRSASGSAIAAGGATVAGLGAVGGGIPGFKSNSSTIANVKQGGWAKRTGAALSSGRGGIFGYRTDAHQGFLNRQLADEKGHGGKQTTRSNHYLRGEGTGKISPELKVIRHMKRGKAASSVALLGGTAATVYGVRRAQGKPTSIRKDKHDTDAYHGALAGGGAAAAGLSYGGARLAEHQGRKWSKRAVRDIDAAAKIVPKLGGHVVNPYPDRVPNKRVPDIAPAMGSAKAANTALKGKSRAQAEAAGALRGAAKQHRYFAGVYGATGRMARKGVAPSLAAAGVGAAGLALSRKKTDVRKDRFLRGYRERISPDAETGYKHLKRGRNDQRAQAVGSAAMAGLGGWLTRHELKSGRALHKNPGALIAAAGTAASAYNAKSNAAGARRYQGKMEGIKAKARSRRAQGLYGPGRGLEPIDTSSARAKALSKAMEGSMDVRATNLAQAYAVNKGLGSSLGKLVRRGAKPVAAARPAAGGPPPAAWMRHDPLPPAPRGPLGSTANRKPETLNRFGLTAAQHRTAQVRAIDARTDARAAAARPARKPVDNTNYQPYVGSYGQRPR